MNNQMDTLNEITLLTIASSPFSHRHDCMRAGFGLFLSVQKLINDHAIPVTVTIYDATLFEEESQLLNALKNTKTLLLGSPTYEQGRNSEFLSFIEKFDNLNFFGIAASAWTTAGGFHTGGTETISSILRTLMGFGANVFTNFQKYMVFSTDERIDGEPGEFTLLDVWFMERFAKVILMNTMIRMGYQISEMMEMFGIEELLYYKDKKNFPPEEDVLKLFEPVRDLINEAKDSDGEQWLYLKDMLSDIH